MSMPNFKNLKYYALGCVLTGLATLLPASSIIQSFFTLKAPGTIQTVDNVLVNSATPGFGVSQSGVTRGTWFANAAGTLFEVGRYDNSGAYLDDYITMTRATGKVEIPHDFQIDGTCTGCVSAGSTSTIFSGSLALATGSIASNSCATPQTVTATGAVVATDTISFVPQASLNAIAGYNPAGMLTITPYLTANTINVDVCNRDQSNAHTPGALTITLKVLR